MKRLLPVAIAVLLLAGCADTAAPPAEPAASAAVEKETPTPAPAAEVGTRQNPYPVGTPGKHSAESVWTFTFAATDTDAWPEIAAANEYNQPPAEGTAFVTAPVHVAIADTPATAEGGDPGASFTISYVTAAGNTFGEVDCFEVLPAKRVWELGTMYGGAQGDAMACAQVPVADVAGGAWRVESLQGNASGGFFVGG